VAPEFSLSSLVPFWFWPHFPGIQIQMVPFWMTWLIDVFFLLLWVFLEIDDLDQSWVLLWPPWCKCLQKAYLFLQ